MQIDELFLSPNEDYNFNTYSFHKTHLWDAEEITIKAGFNQCLRDFLDTTFSPMLAVWMMIGDDGFGYKLDYHHAAKSTSIIR